MGDSELLDEHKAVVNQLLSSDYTQKNIEKLTGHNVYSFRSGNKNAGRLLFTTTKVSGQDYLLVLEYLPTHNYKNSHFLRSGVLRHYLESQAENHVNLVFEKTDKLNEKIIQEISAEGTLSSGALDYYQDKMIELSVSQDEALTLSLPAVISGVAGSGKSCIGVALLSDFVSKSRAKTSADAAKPRILYVTEKPHLVAAIKTAWDALPIAQEEGCTVDILTYQEVLAHNIAGKTICDDKINFSQWYAKYIKNQRKLKKKDKSYTPLDESTMHQEFRICSGYAKERYCATDESGLGTRQSLLLK